MLNLPKTLGISSKGELREEIVSGGLSGARVIKVLDAQDRVLAFVKAASPTTPHLEEELRGEAERLIWLTGQGVRVPEVLGLTSEDGTWLATRPLKGAPASDHFSSDERFAVVTAVAEGLRTLHSLDPLSCPFDRSLPSALAVAEKRTHEGLVDFSWRLAGKKDVTTADALRDLRQAISATVLGELVVSHGDFCLPNVMILPHGDAGFVDVGRSGVADRHSDVADILRSLRSHMNPQYAEPHAQHFLDVYGRAGIESERLRLHDKLEEFFWPAPTAVDAP
ncbi:aminoglycoside 3'-phosphotransferase [Streptomyces dengpaensis]|uniref:Aminoglycoside 3'-phosphotransferase n=1 Tax=Streptomyces dengpaensis TaxID=2049881 RepID=A0ABM6T0F7_9ACTN|nr:aminoglycoside 3'-phosphotransferase [Streptomyces dengpaensis]PIB02750.1 hypothetical protein B1C81_37685 [Streptomyces sp. HG99]